MLFLPFLGHSTQVLNNIYKLLTLTQKGFGTKFHVSQSQRSDDITLATGWIENFEHAYLRPCLTYSHDTLHTYASPREEQIDLLVDPMHP